MFEFIVYCFAWFLFFWAVMAPIPLGRRITMLTCVLVVGLVRLFVFNQS
jgi:hypothetical protein